MLEAMINGALSTCSQEEVFEIKDVLKKIISSIENGNQSETGKRRYCKITNEVLGKIKDYIKDNPNASNKDIEEDCGLGTNRIASGKSKVLEGMTLDDYVNMCRIDPQLLEKRRSVRID